MNQKRTNRLSREQSPYLLQHASNPVDWHPWCDEAFRLAQRETKPIFLSIGYSTCHWCHVMARESFACEQTAVLLNKWFISIKVDREERPDIDQMYMATAVAFNGSGGWPLSAFLFPDGRPFWSATYIPPTSRLGRPGFTEILHAVHTAWTNRRDELEHSAAGLLKALQLDLHKTTTHRNYSRSKATDHAFAALTESFDHRYPGFGNAPKFPRPAVFSFLFRYWYENENTRALEMALTTLNAMARGGIHDHLGGGFHRYSVDSQWRVPHFEKMLYDQAQLATAYLDAFQITGDEQHATVARKVFQYVLRDMRDPAGGFYSAEDADSEDPYRPGQYSEGAFYLWTELDIVRSVGAADGNIFNYCYGVEFDGNALADPHKEFTGRNILYQKHTPEEAGNHFKKNISEIKKALERAEQKLLRKRRQRQRPHLDNKILTSWNGLLIKALAKGGAILQDPYLTDTSCKAATFLRENLF
ncbi:MAG: thioredoxin domain-containing protein, partial [Candidatus Electrothrix sp. AR4]|nr:thioredoxin domain-containing protein [Candidatus Electrothrix sp. AR4]